MFLYRLKNLISLWFGANDKGLGRNKDEYNEADWSSSAVHAVHGQHQGGREEQPIHTCNKGSFGLVFLRPSKPDGVLKTTKRYVQKKILFKMLNAVKI